jgi:hypothetical protein
MIHASQFLVLAAHCARMAIRIGLFALLSIGVVACQAPAGVEPSGPVAPAVETDHPEHDSPIPLPASIEPIAPAIETDHPDAERTLTPPATP